LPVEGTPFGRYQLLALVGRGGMGEVWQAFDTATERIVALKMLPAEFAGDAIYEERFRREARSAAALDEPHVVPIFDFGEIDGRLFVTMRLIKGEDLDSILQRGPIEPARAVRIIEQVAEALHAAHQVDLIHRDVKPSNILVGDNDFAYLIDFGIARAAGHSGLTSASSVIGTWAYMAPERVTAGYTDPRSDVYALTCVLFECLTGSPPFPGGNVEQQIGGHLGLAPPRPSQWRAGVPAAFDDVIAIGMAKNPEQRYSTSRELAAAAHSALTRPTTTRTAVAPPTGVAPATAIAYHTAPNYTAQRTNPASFLSPPPPPTKSPRRRRAALAGAGIAVAAVIAVVLGLILTDENAGVDNGAPTAQPTKASPPQSNTAKTGPLTGTYRADFGPGRDLGGGSLDDAPAVSATYDFRSACPPTGCIATATTDSGPALASNLVFDDVGGSWLSVNLVPPAQPKPEFEASCPSPADLVGEFWEAISLQPRPDGSLSGEYVATNVNNCDVMRTVTLTRVGDGESPNVPDPSALPPRAASAAEALHGRYHFSINDPTGVNHLAADYFVRTYCLRVGEQCSSFMRKVDNTEAVPLIFRNGEWTYRLQSVACNSGPPGTQTYTYPLPQPLQNPIALLSGHIRGDFPANSPCPSRAIPATYERTGD
jgi:serine/threonine-protein kinase